MSMPTYVNPDIFRLTSFQLPGILPSGRRHLDKDRLQGESPHVDEATAKGQ